MVAGTLTSPQAPTRRTRFVAEPIRVDATEYLVTSQTTEGRAYAVTLGTAPSCRCIASAEYGKTCAHIKAALAAEEAYQADQARTRRACDQGCGRPATHTFEGLRLCRACHEARTGGTLHAPSPAPDQVCRVCGVARPGGLHRGLCGIHALQEAVA